MKILHITPKSDGYEEAILLANRVNPKNHLSVIETPDGAVHMTGGFIINSTPEICKVLDAIPKDQQYEFVKSFKQDPFVLAYCDNDHRALINPSGIQY